MQVPDGTEVGLYTVVEKIVAEGGMSQVYRVRHRILGSTHALKVLLPHYAVDRESRERFLNEGKIQARYRHLGAQGSNQFGHCIRVFDWSYIPPSAGDADGSGGDFL